MNNYNEEYRRNLSGVLLRFGNNEQGEIGPDPLRKACEFGLEALVSKHRGKPYRGGRQTRWIKVENRNRHAFDRVKESFSYSPAR